MTLTLSPLVINSELHLELADPYLEEEGILWQLRHSHDSCVGSLPTPQPGEAPSPGRALLTHPLPRALRGGGAPISPRMGKNTGGVGGAARRTRFRVQTSLSLLRAV